MLKTALGGKLSRKCFSDAGLMLTRNKSITDAISVGRFCFWQLNDWIILTLCFCQKYQENRENPQLHMMCNISQLRNLIPRESSFHIFLQVEVLVKPPRYNAFFHFRKKKWNKFDRFRKSTKKKKLFRALPSFSYFSFLTGKLIIIIKRDWKYIRRFHNEKNDERMKLLIIND